jgi:hypothetical protein
MPSFPHSLIGWGPFTNQDCKIVFDKKSVTVFHPNGHPILKGWHDLDGSRLWQLPLTGSPPPPVLRPPLALVSVGPSATMLAFQPLSSHGIQATSAAVEDISVVFLYEATHPIPMTAQASSTTYNPQTLHFPSISTLVSFTMPFLASWSSKCGWTPLRLGTVSPLMVSHAPTWQVIVPTLRKQS